MTDAKRSQPEHDGGAEDQLPGQLRADLAELFAPAPDVPAKVDRAVTDAVRRRFAQMKSAGGGAGAAGVDQASPAVAGRIAGESSKQRLSPLDRMRWWLGPAVGVAVAAALTFAFVFVLPEDGSSPAVYERTAQDRRAPYAAQEGAASNEAAPQIAADQYDELLDQQYFQGGSGDSVASAPALRELRADGRAQQRKPQAAPMQAQMQLPAEQRAAAESAEGPASADAGRRQTWRLDETEILAGTQTDAPADAPAAARPDDRYARQRRDAAGSMRGPAAVDRDTTSALADAESPLAEESLSRARLSRTAPDATASTSEREAARPEAPRQNVGLAGGGDGGGGAAATMAEAQPEAGFAEAQRAGAEPAEVGLELAETVEGGSVDALTSAPVLRDMLADAAPADNGVTDDNIADGNFADGDIADRANAPAVAEADQQQVGQFEQAPAQRLEAQTIDTQKLAGSQPARSQTSPAAAPGQPLAASVAEESADAAAARKREENKQDAAAPHLPAADVDDSGETDIADAVALARLIPLPKDQQEAIVKWDLTGDEQVDDQDVQAVARLATHHMAAARDNSPDAAQPGGAKEGAGKLAEPQPSVLPTRTAWFSIAVPAPPQGDLVAAQLTLDPGSHARIGEVVTLASQPLSRVATNTPLPAAGPVDVAVYIPPTRLKAQFAKAASRRPAEGDAANQPGLDVSLPVSLLFVQVQGDAAALQTINLVPGQVLRVSDDMTITRAPASVQRRQIEVVTPDDN